MSSMAFVCRLGKLIMVAYVVVALHMYVGWHAAYLVCRGKLPAERQAIPMTCRLPRYRAPGCLYDTQATSHQPSTQKTCAHEPQHAAEAQKRSVDGAAPARLIAGHHGQLRPHYAVWRSSLCATAQQIKREESAPAVACKGMMSAILSGLLQQEWRAQTLGPDCKGRR